MFLKQGNGQLIAWSAFSNATRVVRDSGLASTMQDCILQAREGEDVFIGQSLPVGATVGLDGSTTPPAANDPIPTIADVKAYAGKLLEYTDWAATRASEPGGKPIPEDILANRQRIRDRAAIVEAMDPIPTNFRDPQFWN